MHRSLIDQIADEADDFLEGVTSKEQARAAISEMITLRAAQVSGAERQKITDGVMAVLENEGFFESFRGGTAGEDDDESDE
jgi:hypothetical protein